MYFPRAAKITFPLKNAKDNAIARGTDFWKEIRDAEAPEGPSDELEEKLNGAAAGPSTDSPSGSDIAAGGSSGKQMLAPPKRSIQRETQGSPLTE